MVLKFSEFHFLDSSKRMGVDTSPKLCRISCAPILAHEGSASESLAILTVGREVMNSIILLRCAFRRFSFGFSSAAILVLALLVSGPVSADRPIDCEHPTYSTIRESQVFHGYALGDLNAYGELVIALDEDGFSDIDNGTGVVDKVFQIAFEDLSATSGIIAHWKKSELREIRIVKRSAAGYSEMELRFLERPFLAWSFEVDSYGCRQAIDQRSDVPPGFRFASKGMSVVKVSGHRLSLEESLERFHDKAVILDTDDSDPSVEWTYCGHGGPGSATCSVSLPFGLGCSVNCQPGYYACCNSFGGCSCKLNDNDDGDGGDSSMPGGPGDGDGGGGGLPQPDDPGDDEEEDEEEDDDKDNYSVGGGG